MKAPQAKQYQQRFQLSQIFRGCPEIKHTVPMTQKAVHLFRIQDFPLHFQKKF